jgi:hypothetical protein
MEERGNDLPINIKRLLKLIRKILFGLILLFLFSSAPAVRADIAPLQFPGGAILLPGESPTQVRMECIYRIKSA